MPRIRRSARLYCTALERRDVPTTFNIAPADTAGLIAAFNAANNELTHNGPDTIVLAAGSTYAFTAADNVWFGPNALPAVDSDITLVGQGARLVRASSAPPFRFLFVSGGMSGLPAGTLRVTDLEFTGGLAKGGNANLGGGGLGAGGAVFNMGSLNLSRVTLAGNTARGGDAGVTGLQDGGGGIGQDAANGDGGGFGPGFVAPFGAAAGGAASTSGGAGGGGGFKDTAAGGAANGFAGGAGGGIGGLGGRGGFGNTGQPVVTNSVTGAVTPPGNSHPTAGGPAGDGGGGGGGGVTTTGFVIRPAPGAQAGFGGRGPVNGIGPGGGGGVGGGGGGSFSVNSSFFGGGGGGFGGGGGGGRGGQATNTNAAGNFQNNQDGGDGGFGGGGGASAFLGRGGRGGFGGGDGTGGTNFPNPVPVGGAGAGMGGAIFNLYGTTEAFNCTFTGNTAESGRVFTFRGASGFGGGVFNLNGVVAFMSSTLAGNTVIGLNDTRAEGGAAYNLALGFSLAGGPASASCVMRNTIAADSVGGRDVVTVSVPSSTFVNVAMVVGSFNLIESGTSISEGVILTSADPRLGPLADNGGPTRTLLPAPTSPAVNAGFSGFAVFPTQSPTDQRGSGRVVGAETDIGAVELQPPRVGEVAVNGGAAQRSRVTDLKVTFTARVTFAAAAGAAFTLTRLGDGAVVTFSATAAVVGGVTVVTINGFGGPASEGGSLADGRYTLSTLAGQITADGQALDGDANGSPGGDHHFSLHRLFGDATGDGTVDLLDLGAFRSTFNADAGSPAYLAFLDADGNGVVDLIDLGQFRTRFNQTLFP